MTGARRRTARPAVVLAVVLAVACLLIAGAGAGRSAPPTQAAEPVPVLAYYYIWFNATSWSRAKSDYPILGRYSSDEASTMRRHIRWARAAGIDGFVVSWKSTPTLDRRLDTLARVAADERFRLAVIYQGLDFFRDPLPVARVVRDLGVFSRRYAPLPAFRVFERPLVVVSGTWRFSRAQVARIVAGRRDDLLLLASEKDVEGIRRLRGLVDGDAYYWSSVDPRHTPRYEAKLAAMGRAVHDAGGLWLAPAAAGFDAREIGGHRVIGRRGGATLREEMNAAIASSPDAIALISWNEFSENSHVEPSEVHGYESLRVLADIAGTRFAVSTDLDSSEPSGRGGAGRLSAALGVLGALVVGGALLGRRQRASARASRGGRGTG